MGMGMWEVVRLIVEVLTRDDDGWATNPCHRMASIALYLH